LVSEAQEAYQNEAPHVLLLKEASELGKSAVYDAQRNL